MTALAPGRRLLALGLLPAALVSCAERLAEDGPAAARASKLEFAITPMVGGSAVDFTWQPRNAGYPRLSSYRLDIGQGSNDLASIEFPGTQTSFRWMPAPVGELHAQVATLEGSKVVTFSDHVVIKSIDPRQMIDALLFASGPLVPSHDPGRELSSDRVLGWGAQALDLIVSESLPVTALSALERAARQVRTATRDRILPAIARAPEPLPRARSGEVTIAMVSPQEAESRCGGVGDDCVIVYYWPARMSIDRAEILLPSSPTGSLACSNAASPSGLAAEST